VKIFGHELKRCKHVQTAHIVGNSPRTYTGNKLSKTSIIVDRYIVRYIYTYIQLLKAGKTAVFVIDKYNPIIGTQQI